MAEDPWDGMPPLQVLVTEVLIARTRLGESSWPFPARCRQALEKLAVTGWVTYERGYQPRTLQARLTAEGRMKFMSGTYKAPLTRVTEEALFLRQHGERAPGGSENWRDWDLSAERVLRSGLPVTGRTEERP